MECGVPCSKPTCDFCRTGKYHACPDVVFFSTPPHHGTLRRYHAHPEAWLHKIPDHVTYEEGSLLEPLTVALAGIDRSGLRLADPLVICGAGPIGLVTLLAANAAGAEPIVITDIDENRLKKAKEIVPRVRPVKVEKTHSAQDVGANIVKELGQEAKLVMECTGVESSVHSGIYVSPQSSIHPQLAVMLILVVGHSLRWYRLRYWCRQRLPEYPLHAHVRQRDRSEIPVPIPRYLPEVSCLGCGWHY